MMACGAMHEHYEFQVVPALDNSSKNVRAPPTPPIALASYNKAITALMRQLSAGSGSVETVVMCCLLFTCLECLRGDTHSAAAHLRSGGSILASWLSRNKTIKGYEKEPPLTTPSSNNPQLVRNSLIPIFQRLGTHISVASAISTADFNNLIRNDLATNDEILSGFQDLSQARNSLLSLCGLAARYVQSLAQSKYEHIAGEEEVQALLGLRQRFVNWDRSYAELLKTTAETDRNSRRALVLLVQRRWFNVVIRTALLTHQCAFDEYMDDFVFIVCSGERLLAQVPNDLADPKLETFSLEEGITAACYYVASRCRNPVLRRDAIKLLREGPARQGIWNSRLFAEVGDKIVEYEESYISKTSIEPPASLTGPDPTNMQPVGPGTAGLDVYRDACPAGPDVPFDPVLDPGMGSAPKKSMAYYSDLKRAASFVPEEARIHLADIQENRGESPHYHVVTYMAKPDGLQADWKTWTEQVFI